MQRALINTNTVPLFIFRQGEMTMRHLCASVLSVRSPFRNYQHIMRRDLMIIRAIGPPLQLS